MIPQQRYPMMKHEAKSLRFKITWRNLVMGCMEFVWMIWCRGMRINGNALGVRVRKRMGCGRKKCRCHMINE
jgi:hypothetical protein